MIIVFTRTSASTTLTISGLQNRMSTDVTLVNGYLLHYPPQTSNFNTNICFRFGTSHMVTADKDGLTFSLTTTTNLPFGSHVMVPETGIVLNSQMDGKGERFL